MYFFEFKPIAGHIIDLTEFRISIPRKMAIVKDELGLISAWAGCMYFHVELILSGVYHEKQLTKNALLRLQKKKKLFLTDENIILSLIFFVRSKLSIKSTRRSKNAGSPSPPNRVGIFVWKSSDCFPPSPGRPRRSPPDIHCVATTTTAGDAECFCFPRDPWVFK